MLEKLLNVVEGEDSLYVNNCLLHDRVEDSDRLAKLYEEYFTYGDQGGYDPADSEGV